jgi:hypothetical protein
MVVRAVSLSTTDLSTHSLSAVIQFVGIRSLVEFGKTRVPLAHPVLYPRRLYTTHYLNSFRGEPAISEFDWPFTPSHRSSPDFATSVGSVLQHVLPCLQPAHG